MKLLYVVEVDVPDAGLDRSQIENIIQILNDFGESIELDLEFGLQHIDRNITAKWKPFHEVKEEIEGES